MPDAKLTTPRSGRLLKTEVPGPASQELARRRAAAIPRGVGTTLPVFVDPRRARLRRGRRRQPVDRLRVRDLGHQRRQQRSGGRRGDPGPGRALHPHLLPGDALRGLRRSLRAPQRPHPRASREALVPRELGRGGRGERRQGGPLRHRPKWGGRLRPRFPRTHPADHEPHGKGHALQARASVLSLPRCTGPPIRTPSTARAGSTRPCPCSRPPSAPSRSPAWSSSPSRARAASWSPSPDGSPGSPSGAPATGCCSLPMRCRRGWDGRAPGSHASTRESSRTS